MRSRDGQSYLNPRARWLRGTTTQAPILEGREFVRVRDAGVTKKFYFGKRGSIIKTGECRWPGADVLGWVSNAEGIEIAKLDT